MVRRQPGDAVEESVQVRRLLSDTGERWARVVGDEGEADREMAFSPGGRYVAVALQGGDVAVWNLHPLPHAVLCLEVPPQLTEEDGYVCSLGWGVGGRIEPGLRAATLLIPPSISRSFASPPSLLLI